MPQKLKTQIRGLIQDVMRFIHLRRAPLHFMAPKVSPSNPSITLRASKKDETTQRVEPSLSQVTKALVQEKAPLLTLPPEPSPSLPSLSPPTSCSWELQAVPDLAPPPKELISYFCKTLSATTQIIPLQVIALLLLVSDTPAHKLFLEGLCRMMTRAGCPASVMRYSQKLLAETPSSVRLILLPLSLIKNIFPQAEVHQPLQRQPQLLWFPLADLDLYLNDPQEKRTLWKSIIKIKCTKITQM